MTLANQAERIGRFYAVANPVKLEKEIGAVRERFSNDEWQTAVLKRMHEALVIIFRPALSYYTNWELEQLIINNYLEKTIVVARREEPSAYYEFLRRMSKMVKGLPINIDSRELYICFNEDLTVTTSDHITNTKHFKKLIVW